jgi:hypothetical protein
VVVVVVVTWWIIELPPCDPTTVDVDDDEGGR